MEIWDGTWSGIEYILGRGQSVPIVRKTPLVYSQHLWRGRRPDEQQPSQEELEIGLNERVRSPGPVILDVEHIPWQDVWTSGRVLDGQLPTEQQCLDGHQFLAELVDRVREQLPVFRIGYYSLFLIGPGTRYEKITQATTAIHRHRQNGRTIAHAVDFLAPSFYCNWERFDQWRQYYRWAMGELLEFGKPLYPFIWQRYAKHPAISDDLRGKYVGSGYWRGILDEIARSDADGAILWDWEQPMTDSRWPDLMTPQDKRDYLRAIEQAL